MRARGPGRAAPLLLVAAGVAAVLLVLAAVFHMALILPQNPLSGRLTPVLSGAAILLVGLLAAPRLPGLAWAAVALSAPIATIEIVAVVRTFEPDVHGAPWRDLVIIAAFAMTSAALLNGAYAWRRPVSASSLTRVAMGVVALAVLATIVAAGWAVADADRPLPPTPGELTPLRVAMRICLVSVLAGYLLGAARTLGPAASRAADRARRDPRVRDAGLWTFLGLFADELVPSRVEARRLAAEGERARLAADLHAHILPELRRLAAAAESAGAPADVQVDLRRALEDVEQLMHQRQSIVLEQFGLVAALEWLAERTEERSRLRVHLELDDSIPDGPDAIEARVASAAFRIALLGLDNVVRHAGAATATLRLTGDGSRLRLTVEDDGAPATLETSHGRGIADMRTAASESGGAITFVGRAGARIEASWPVSLRARNHAPETAVIADRSEQASA